MLTQYELPPELVEAEVRKLKAETEKVLVEAEALRRHRDIEANKDDPHQQYLLWSDISTPAVKSCVDTLNRWHRQYPGAPFTLNINSPGGGVQPGLALVDFLHEMKLAGHEIITVTNGWAASMGAVIFQAGTKRIMGKHAWLLIHEVSGHAAGKASEMEDEAVFVKRLQEQLLDILEERSTYTRQQIKTKWKRKDWWQNAEEALAGGFVDEVR